MHPVAKLSELKEGQAKKITLSRCRARIDGFLVRIGGHLAAYENRCCHYSVALDGGTGKFLTPEANAIRCIHHSALFDPVSGCCLRGPCLGDHLRSLPILIKDDIIYLMSEEFPG